MIYVWAALFIAIIIVNVLIVFGNVWDIFNEWRKK